MLLQRHNFRTWDGTLLSAATWTPTTSSTAFRPLVVIHGMGEHLLRYEWLANEVQADGYQVYSFDLRGHGRSPGSRGDAPGLHYHVQDVLAFLKWVSSQQPLVSTNLPVMAHSMGGLIALHAALTEPAMFQSLYLISPYFRPAFQPQAWRLAAARILNRVWPGITLNVGLKLEQFAHDREVQLTIRDDPASHQKMSARMAMQLLESGENLLQTPEQLAVHCVLIHGDQDTINSHVASQEFASRHSQIEFVNVPGGSHQIHNDAATRPLVLAHLRTLLTNAVPQGNLPRAGFVAKNEPFR